MHHLSRLTLALQALLHEQRVGALGSQNADATPLVSMVPFAIDAQGACMVIHVSGLAAHSANLQRAPVVSLMVMRPETPGAPVHALERVTIQGTAAVLDPGSTARQSASDAYLARFPEAREMLQLGDFRFVAIAPLQARQIAGFGAARSIERQELLQVLARADTPRNPR